MEEEIIKIKAPESKSHHDYTLIETESMFIFEDPEDLLTYMC